MKKKKQKSFIEALIEHQAYMNELSKKFEIDLKIAGREIAKEHRRNERAEKIRHILE